MSAEAAPQPDTEVQPGVGVHAGDPVVVDRYTTAARINHWITATSLVLLAISGLALFHPSLYGLTALFGGYAAARYVHFFCMAVIVAFIVVHVALALLVPKSLRAIIIGR